MHVDAWLSSAIDGLNLAITICPLCHRASLLPFICHFNSWPSTEKLDSVPYIEVDCQLCTAAEGAGGRRQYIYTFAKTQFCKQAAVTVFGKQAATQYFASRHCHIYWQIASTVITCGISIVRTAIYKADQVAIKEKALSSCSGIV